MPKKTTLPGPVTAAFKLFGLPITSSWREVGVRYRALAKQHHPDRAGSATEFAKVSSAYDTLKKYFGKK
jgi:curved DNA-binding protein CbpA